MINLPSYVVDFMDVFQKHGFKIYVVGGAVRDLLLDRNKTGDQENWDFTTNATPDGILKLFPKGFYNNTYGTVGLSQTIKDKTYLFEVTTFRKESGYGDFRHPEKIQWAKTVEEDLARRDFTINAIAYDGKNLVDPYNGQEHIKNKLIVAVGDPEKRFSEDALRLMRAIRFASELGFIIEEKTRLAIAKHVKLIANISWERIREELFKILASSHPAEGILFMKNTGLLSIILPELDICFIIPQKSPKRHHIFDAGTHMVMSLRACPSNDIITRFATLLHDIGKAKTFWKDAKTGLITFHNHEMESTKQAEKIAERLKLSNEQKHKLITLIRYHQFTVSEIQTDKAVRRFIRQVGKEYIKNMLDLRTGDRIGSGATATSWRLELFKKRIEKVQKQPFSIQDLKIDGNDVMKALNIKPGLKVGEILKKIFNDVEKGRVKNERKELLQEIKSFK